MLWWFWWWLLFVLVFLMLPLGYGAGYRRWGWPSYRRGATSPGERAELEQEQVAAEAAGWGIFAIFFWVLAGIAVFWLVLALAAAA